MPLDRPRLLVVNDDQASLLALSTLIATWEDVIGYHVIAVDSGYAALREIRRRRAQKKPSAATIF